MVCRRECRIRLAEHDGVQWRAIPEIKKLKDRPGKACYTAAARRRSSN
jgi:hypothetical protein